MKSHFIKRQVLQINLRLDNGTCGMLWSSHLHKWTSSLQSIHKTLIRFPWKVANSHLCMPNIPPIFQVIHPQPIFRKLHFCQLVDSSVLMIWKPPSKCITVLAMPSSKIMYISMTYARKDPTIRNTCRWYCSGWSLCTAYQ